MRLASVAVVALLSSVALVGCGDDSGGIELSDEQASTTTEVVEDVEDTDTDSGDDAEAREAIVTYIAGSNGSLIDRVSGQCVADALLGDLSADGLDTITAGGDFDLTAFSTSDADLLVSALDECVDLEDAAEAFADGITEEASLPVTEDEAECASAEFASEYAGAGEFIAAVTSMSEDEAGGKLFEALGPCISPESAVGFMTTILGEQGLDPALSECVATKLVETLGVEGLMAGIAATGSGGDSTDIETASADAGAACAAEGLGVDPGVGGGLSGN